MLDKYFPMFRRKRCKQCGEDLLMFTKVDFCDLCCYTIYEKGKKQYEEAVAALKAKEEKTNQ